MLMELIRREEYDRRVKWLKVRYPHRWAGEHRDLYIESDRQEFHDCMCEAPSASRNRSPVPCRLIWAASPSKILVEYKS
jgi:hypothetical protein